MIPGMQTEFGPWVTNPCQWREPQPWLGSPRCLLASLVCHKGPFFGRGRPGAVILQITVSREMAALLCFQFSILTTRGPVRLYHILLYQDFMRLYTPVGFTLTNLYLCKF